MYALEIINAINAEDEPQFRGLNAKLYFPDSPQQDLELMTTEDDDAEDPSTL